MKHFGILVLSLSLFGASESLFSLPGESDEANEILEEMEKRVASSDKRRDLRSLVIKGKMEMKGMPLKASFEELYAGKERARLNFDYGNMGTQTQGSTGDMSWSTDPSFGVMIRKGEEQGSVKRLYGINRLRSWNDLYASVEMEGEVELAGKTHVKLKMSAPSSEDSKASQSETWYIEKESKMLTRVDVGLPNPTGGFLQMQYWFSDWKEVDGYLFPHRKVQKIGEVEIEYQVTEVLPNKSISPERLAPPDDVVAAMKDSGKPSTGSFSEPGTCEIVTVKKQPVVTIRMEVKEAEISQKLAIMLPEVLAHITTVGAQMAGPPFSRYHTRKDGVIDLEAGIPVRAPIESKGRVKASSLPAGKVLSTWHVGPYGTLSKTYDFATQWMEKHGHVAAGGFWEIYWTDPGLEQDPNNWKTEILFPIKE